MSPSDGGADGVEEAVRHCYSTWGGRYYDDYYGDAAAYPPVHRDILVGLLEEAGARSVLDAGCGPASFLRALSGRGMELLGFDLTPEMVEEARRVLGAEGVVWRGSVLEPSDFRRPDRPGEPVDAAVCIGVLPHVPEGADARVLASLRDAVRPGGLVAVSARNRLFALFTLNRYSHELFRDELIGADALRALARDDERAGLDAALADLEERFLTHLPPVRAGHEDEPGYDEVLSRTHDPRALARAAEEAGLVGVRTLHYHYHALPPFLEHHVPDLARRASLAMEDPGDPRGLVMASAVLVVGTRP